VKGKLAMDTHGLIEALGRRMSTRSVVALACTFCCGCQSWQDHRDYFAEMAAAMPARGCLWLDSKVGGLSASYLGPGLAHEPTVRLLSARYNDERGELKLYFASPVKLCKKVSLADLVELTDDNRERLEVDRVFEDTGSPTSRCQRMIFVKATLKDDAPNRVNVRLIPGPLAKCCPCTVCGTVPLEIPK